MAKQANHQAHYQPNYQPHHPQLPAGEAWEHTLNNGLTLRGEFIESAAGAAQPVLHFAHGNGLSCRSYEHFLAYAHQHFGLFLHDSQGHGLSDAGDPKNTPFVGWNKTSKRMAKVIKAQQQNGFLQNRRLIGAGHSFGGALTLLAAQRDPALFESLVLFDAMMFPPAMAIAMSSIASTRVAKHSPLAKQAAKRTAQWADMESAFQYFYRRGMLTTWHDDSTYSYLNHNLAGTPDGQQALHCPPWIEASIFSDAPRGLWKTLKALTVPTQLFYGDKTYNFIEPAAKRASKINPVIQAEAIAGNHFFMLESPNCLADHSIWQTLLNGRS